MSIIKQLAEEIEEIHQTQFFWKHWAIDPPAPRLYKFILVKYKQDIRIAQWLDKGDIVECNGVRIENPDYYFTFGPMDREEYSKHNSQWRPLHLNLPNDNQ